MRTVIAGGHGQIALRLERLITARGDSVVGLIRNPAHADDLREAGAEPAVLDLESATTDAVAAVLAGADAAVFSAGAGAGSPVNRKQAVDLEAAVLLADAAEQAGVRRFLIVSSMGADAHATSGPPDYAAYRRAKGAADDAIRARTNLAWTILRPGSLSNDAGTGRVLLSTGSTGRGGVPRDDVAAVLLALLDTPATEGLTLELIAGDTDVDVAVGQLG